MYVEILDRITIVGLIFLALAILIWGAFYRRMPRGIQILGILLCCNLLIQFIAHILSDQNINNFPLLHFNALLEIVFYPLFFREVYIEQSFFKKHVEYIIIGTVLLLVLNSMWLESIYEFNAIGKRMVQITIIIYVLLYFFDAFGRVDFSKRDTQVISLICFGILIYYAGSIFLFMFTHLAFDGGGKEGYLMVNIIFSTIFQLITLLAFSKIAFQPRKRPS